MVKYLLSPDLLEVKDADLVNLPATVGALDEGLHLQDVVLRRLELRLCDVRLWLTGVVPEGHGVPGYVRHALLTEGVLVRE